MDLEITEQERASNLSCQIKQLLIGLQTQTKPQLVASITLIENGQDGQGGVTKEALAAALGKDADKILKKCKAINAAI